MYRIFTSSAVERIFKKMDSRKQEKVKKELLVLTKNPYVGERLTGSLNFLCSYHFTVFGKPFRAAYSVDENEHKIILYYLGPRGEFYQRLRRLFRK